MQEMAKDAVFAKEFKPKLRDDDAEILAEMARAKGNLDLPASSISWYLAAAYSNWMSKKKDLSNDQWCYTVNDDDKYAEGVTIKKWQDEPKLRGYRLPTEAEWEYVCRAGTNTRWSCGESETLLPRFARYDVGYDDVPLPIGSLKPNDWGLFDMHGNVWEWCQDGYRRESSGDLSVGLTVLNDESRVLRGGSFYNHARYGRSAYRNNNSPVDRFAYVGFRLARTYP
jgi:formylglycine-generating enzyme required for sulfatase activity